MALSNILKEPRREITETLLGFAVVVTVIGVPLLADYGLAIWLEDGKHSLPERMLFGPLIALTGIALIALLTMVTYLIHEIGEAICNSLEAKGVQLRPRQRYH